MHEPDAIRDPKILTDGRTPEEWAEVFAKRGLKVPPRTIRRLAKQTGQFRGLGRMMILMPEHIDAISEVLPCRLNANQNNAAVSDGPR